MNEAIFSPEALRHAISVLEAQRQTLGEQVADVTIATLQEKLATALAQTAVAPPQRPSQRKQLTILFATLSGFSTVAAAAPETSHPDLINLLWRRLDGAIAAHGGMVDKHIGDTVMGLFGVPVAGEDDPENAIRAALAMRAALSDFIGDIQEQWSTISHLTNVPKASELRLRIGINTGPVLLGEVGSSDEYTVIGDPVNVASRLEQAAPDGGILISHATYQLARGLFDYEPLGPIEVKGKRDPISVYLVLGAKPRPLRDKSRGVEGVETRMVGRDAELRALQSALTAVRQKRQGQIITIVGEAGVGKSRLAYEFSHWAKTAVPDIAILQGRADQGMKQMPYSLVRDLFVNIFAIQDSDPPAVVEEKFRQGLADLRQEENTAEWQRQIRSLAQLVGLNLAEAVTLPLPPPEATQAQERVFDDVAHLLHALLRQTPATLLLLEDVHWADEGSLNLIDRLAQLCLADPLLIVCVARPSLFEWRDGWGSGTAVENTTRSALPPIPQIILPLSPLSRAESELLVHDILRYLPEIPPDLSNLIVDRAEGNPFYVEELVKVLIEDGAIIPGETEWRVLARHLAGVRVPPTLTGVLQARLDRLSSLERVSLQRAAVIGRIFWDTAVVLMNTLAPDTAIHEPDSVAALQALEKREMIFQRDASTFAGSKAYLFKHEMLREVAYESVLLRTRPAYHKQVADWLAEQSGERVGEYAGLIADHYERADEPLAAAEMHELAALRALDMADPAQALRHYRRILLLLAETPSQATWLVMAQERVAQLLLMQARLTEAAACYQEMRQTAERDGNLAAQARAWNGLAGVLFEQAQFTAMLEASERAEKVAWLIGEEMQLIQALRDKAEAYRGLADEAQALMAARQALAFSERLGEGTAVVLSLHTLGAIYIAEGQSAYAQHYLELLQTLAFQWSEIGRNRSEIGLAYRTAAKLQTQLGQFDAAGQNLLTALRFYQEAEQRAETAQTLAQMGDLARFQGRSSVALPLYREAIANAHARGDRYAEMRYRVGLAGALQQAGHGEVAERLLARLAQYAENQSYMEGWRHLGQVYLFWAEALLAGDKATTAAQASQRAAELAFELADDKLRGEAWRVLGQAAAQLPEGERPLRLRGHPYTPADCFQESIRLLRRAGGSSSSAFREQALTLRAWAAYEATYGNPARSQIMAQEAEALAAEIGMQS